MKMKARCIYVGSEPYTSQKTGKTSLRVALAGENDAETLNAFFADLTAFDGIPRFSALTCLFDYSEKFGRLSLLAFEPVTDKK